MVMWATFRSIPEALDMDRIVSGISWIRIQPMFLYLLHFKLLYRNSAQENLEISGMARSLIVGT